MVGGERVADTGDRPARNGELMLTAHRAGGEGGEGRGGAYGAFRAGSVHPAPS